MVYAAEPLTEKLRPQVAGDLQAQIEAHVWHDSVHLCKALNY